MRNQLLATASAVLFAITSTDAKAGRFFALTTDESRAGASAGTEGCNGEPGVARGFLVAAVPRGNCHAGQLGSGGGPEVFAGDTSADAPAVAAALFETAPLQSAMAVGGIARLVAYISAESSSTAVADQRLDPDLSWELRAQESPGIYDIIASGEAFRISSEGVGGRGVAHLEIPAYTVATGNTLQLLLFSNEAPEARILYGGTDPDGNSYADSSITFGSGGAGSPAAATLLLLALAACCGLRARRRALRTNPTNAPEVRGRRKAT